MLVQLAVLEIMTMVVTLLYESWMGITRRAGRSSQALRLREARTTGLQSDVHTSPQGGLKVSESTETEVLNCYNLSL